MEDERTGPPTAAQLGISEAAYERIVRDLEQRRPAPAAQRRTTRRVVTGVVAAVLVVWAAGRLVGGAGAGEPAYAFLDTDGAGRPVAFSSCRPLQIAVYPAGGPTDAEALVREAVAQLRAKTGLDLVVTGSYDGHAPNWNFEAAPITPTDPVSVSWQDGTAIAELTSDTAGLGGSPVLTTPNGVRVRVAGTIALSRGYYAQLAERGDHDEALAVLLHEFGHVLSLDHVHAAGELMNEDNLGRTRFGPGDVEGLRQLGRGPCV